MTMVISGSDGVTFPDSTNQFSGAYFSFKNRVINGDMRIAQRGTAAVTTNGAFPVDRFVAGNNTDGAYSAQQDSSAPADFQNSVKFTTTTADGTLTGGQSLQFQQPIEGTNVADLGWGAAGAKTVTVSFWVRSSLTGTFGGAVTNDGVNRSYIFTYSIAVADTWEYKTVTIPGDTTGTWLKNTGTGLRLYFGLGQGPDLSGTAGSWTGNTNINATGAVSVIGTLNATWFITGVQLEVGSVATPFERRPFGAELVLCQRYLPKVGFDTDDQIGVGQATGSNTWAIQIPHIVQPRVAPTGISAGTASNFNVINSTASGVAVTAINFSAGGLSGSRVTGSVSSGLTAGNATILRAENSSGFILFTGCEL